MDEQTAVVTERAAESSKPSWLRPTSVLIEDAQRAAVADVADGLLRAGYGGDIIADLAAERAIGYLWTRYANAVDNYREVYANSVKRLLAEIERRKKH